MNKTKHFKQLAKDGQDVRDVKKVRVPKSTRKLKFPRIAMAIAATMLAACGSGPTKKEAPLPAKQAIEQTVQQPQQPTEQPAINVECPPNSGVAQKEEITTDSGTKIYVYCETTTATEQPATQTVTVSDVLSSSVLRLGDEVPLNLQNTTVIFKDISASDGKAILEINSAYGTTVTKVATGVPLSIMDSNGDVAYFRVKETLKGYTLGAINMIVEMLDNPSFATDITPKFNMAVLPLNEPQMIGPYIVRLADIARNSGQGGAAIISIKDAQSLKTVYYAELSEGSVVKFAVPDSIGVVKKTLFKVVSVNDGYTLGVVNALISFDQDMEAVPVDANGVALTQFPVYSGASSQPVADADVILSYDKHRSTFAEEVTLSTPLSLQDVGSSRIVLPLLGREYPVSSADLAPAGSIDLIQETNYGVLGLGDCLVTNTGYYVCLEEMSRVDSTAFISVYKLLTEELVTRDKINPGQNKVIIAPNGDMIVLKAWNTNNGYSLDVKTVELSAVDGGAKLSVDGSYAYLPGFSGNVTSTASYDGNNALLYSYTIYVPSE